MKIFFLLVFPCLCFGQLTPLKNPAGVGYLEHLPADYYIDTTKVYPCIIFLHGSGERGTGSAYDLNRVAASGIPKQIKAGHNMCFYDQCFIVLSPQTYKWSWRYDALAFAKWALLQYRIDPRKLYVTGLSMGGEGTWLAACLTDNEPNIWAAIAPVCGRASYTNGQDVARKKIPVWAFHGSADTAIPVSGLLNPMLGMKSISGNVAVITVYENQQHYIWDRVYNTSNAWHKPNIYQWFLTKSK